MVGNAPLTALLPIKSVPEADHATTGSARSLLLLDAVLRPHSAVNPVSPANPSP